MPSIKIQERDDARRVRIVLGVLLGLNLIAAGLVLYPPGGSAVSLQLQLTNLQTQIVQRRAQVERTRQHASSVEKGRADGDLFLSNYFLSRRTAFSTVRAALDEAARAAHVKEREISFPTEPVEGSDNLSMMSINANYEATYRDLLSFVREIDGSPLLLIVESLNAAPQTGSNTLAVSLKIQAFVREDATSDRGPVAQNRDRQGAASPGSGTPAP